MAQVLIRKIPDPVLKAWRKRAKKKGRSLEAELRETIVTFAPRDHSEFLKFADKVRESLKGTYKSDSTALIREDRDR